MNRAQERELRQRAWKVIVGTAGLVLAVSWFLAHATPSWGTEIQWTRISGTVMGTNAQTQMLTLQVSGDLISLKITPEVDVYLGKEMVNKLSELKLGDRVKLLYNPKAPVAKDPADQPDSTGIYPPMRTR